MQRREFLKQAVTSVGLTSAAALAMAGRAARAAGTPPDEKPAAGWRKALVFGMLPGKLSIHDRLAMARDAGFEGVEAHTMSDQKQVDEMRAAAEKTGIKVHSIMIEGHWQWPLSSPDAEVVKKCREAITTSLKNARDLGASTALLVPAVVTSKIRYQDAYERSQKEIRELLPAAQDLGVVIAVENVWNKFLLSPMEFARYVDEIQHPFLKAYFDAGNVNIWGYPQDWIRTLGKRIVKVHVKGFDARNYEKYRFVELREGSIEWPEVMKAFDEIGYHGWVTAELNGGDNLERFRAVSRDLDAIFAKK